MTEAAGDVLGLTGERPLRLATQVLARVGEDDDRLVDLVRHLLVELSASMLLDEPALLTDQLRWQRSRLEVLAAGLDLDAVLEAVEAVLAEEVDAAELAVVQAHLGAARTGLGERAREPADASTLGPRSRTYLDRALARDRDAAVRVVTDALDEGVDVGDLLLEVLQPAQEEIGRLWERGEITVAQEHFTTAVTQLAMSLLYPHLGGSGADGPRLVATGVAREGHEVGLRMVADLLERAGWRTTYLGTGTPAADVVSELARVRADVLAVSVTLTSHVGHVRTLVDAVRADPRCRDVRVVVGGRPFRLAPRLAGQVGADAFARDGRDVVGVLGRMVAERRSA